MFYIGLIIIAAVVFILVNNQSSTNYHISVEEQDGHGSHYEISHRKDELPN